MILIRPHTFIETPAENLRGMLGRIESAGRVCYKSEAIMTEFTAPVFVANLIKRGHESVLEHESLTIRFVCDRGVSHELVRHRLAAFSQESTRYCDYNKGHVTFVIPPWVKIRPQTYADYSQVEGWNPESGVGDLIWVSSMINAEIFYNKLRTNGAWAPQEARSVLPNSLKTEVVMTANLREWRHVLKLRASAAAHPQMRELIRPLLQELRTKVPIVFDDVPDGEGK